MLLCVFIGANFVAATFLAWLPSLVEREFSLGLAQSAFDLDRLAAGERPRGGPGGLAGRPGGPASREAAGFAPSAWGLILAAPFVLLTGWSSHGRAC